LNINKLQKILDLMDERGIAEVEMRGLFRTVRIVRAGTAPNVSFISAPPLAAAGPPARALASPPDAAAAPAAAPAPGDEKLLVVKSPMVGTFYRAPAPDAEPYVNVGSAVKKGQVLCIIEAMKIMNEIESEYAGAIVRLHVENGAPVEYGQPLFSIQPA
jgi:acetyl-CoA carboxylase biotin carboxyl carrier protein